MTVEDIQAALVVAGFDPGPVDGILGRRTIQAIEAFQAARGLKVDGIVGPRTLARLFPRGQPEPSPFGVPANLPWLAEAHRLIGTRERPGAGSNEAILGWAEDLELADYDDDDIPWCGLFVAHCVGSQLPREVLPTTPLGARTWARFGDRVSPSVGAVMVFWRGSRDGWKGHVGFYWAEDDGAYQILGGNQSNTVSITRIARDRLLDARWPTTAMPPTVLTRTASTSGRLLSQNEA
ncbi:MAG: TIGR02594 family protein [Geminicoccaceae bacterium]|nr:TIGR02594 family protein [Geminicoccaceae bacterium]